MASDGSPEKKQKQKQKRARDGGDAEEPEVEIQRLTAAGHAALRAGDHHTALQHFKSAFNTASKLRERRLRRACALNLGAAYVEAGEPRRGLDVLTRATPGERGERIADLQFNLATAHEALGQQTRAARHYQQAALLYGSQGDAGAEGDACVRLARCHLSSQEWAEAAVSLQRAAESYKTAGNTSAAALALKDAGKHMLQSGHSSSEEIISVLTDSLETSAAITDQETLGKLLNDVGLSFSQMRLFSEAAECYTQALPLVSSTPQRRAVVLQNLGAVHNTLGQYQQALSFSRDAAALHGSLGSRGAQGRCFSNLGFALVELDELEEAWESYIHAQQAFRDAGDPSGQWQVCEGLGGIKLQMRDPEKAVDHYKEALRLLSQCQDASASAQERLVTKLSAALQQQILLQTRGAAPRIGPGRHSPRQLRKVRSDAQQWRRETDGENADTDRKHHSQTTATSSESLLKEEQGRHSALPEANRNLNNTYEKADFSCSGAPARGESETHSEREHNGAALTAGRTSHTGGPAAESVKPRPGQINGTHPLVRSAVTPPPSEPGSSEATPLVRRLRSRFCTVM